MTARRYVENAALVAALSLILPGAMFIQAGNGWGVVMLLAALALFLIVAGWGR